MAGSVLVWTSVTEVRFRNPAVLWHTRFHSHFCCKMILIIRLAKLMVAYFPSLAIKKKNGHAAPCRRTTRNHLKPENGQAGKTCEDGPARGAGRRKTCKFVSCCVVCAVPCTCHVPLKW